MCLPKAPKVQPTSPTAKTPDPAIIRNPYLDNATEFAQARKGRSSLRIDPGTPSSIRIPLPPSAPTPATPSGVPPKIEVRQPSVRPSAVGGRISKL